jgi:hypothetical protein
VIDWTMIDGVDAARRFGDQLLELPRSFADRTSISGGIESSPPPRSSLRLTRRPVAQSASRGTAQTMQAGTSKSPETRCWRREW